MKIKQKKGKDAWDNMRGGFITNLIPVRILHLLGLLLERNLFFVPPFAYYSMFFILYARDEGLPYMYMRAAQTLYAIAVLHNIEM